ncbi:hypothetical protein BCR34DRAFT_617583 [Clohesyomyces aquaticus]|uniref:Heterokaryon incompatibility domain-containing protein n=1 Tax=Clohesyomyces aquaticus TaxID=1231657 RepID=A0A1Y1Z1Q6_9PLEO|nr:hypothetical protein BCR34DRAFT_617583 [Clohesyomyces aquaticus]
MAKPLHHGMELLSHYRHLGVGYNHQQRKNDRILMELETENYHLGTTNEIYERRPSCSLCRIIYATLECRVESIHVLRSETPVYLNVEADSWSMFLRLSLEKASGTGFGNNGSMRIRLENSQTNEREGLGWRAEDRSYCSLFRELYQMEPSNWQLKAKIQSTGDWKPLSIPYTQLDENVRKHMNHSCAVVDDVQTSLRHCIEHHGEQCNTNIGRSAILDLFFIDCLNMNIVLGQTIANYIALSYVWGRPMVGQLQLSKANFEGLTQPGALLDLWD